MTELDAYLEFRKEIDTMFFPKYSRLADVTTRLDENGNVIGLLMVECNHIDCLWIAEKYRGKGIGYELVVEHTLNNGFPRTLRILHNNRKANIFWNKVFTLVEIESNPYDTLYQINGFKSVI